MPDRPIDLFTGLAEFLGAAVLVVTMVVWFVG
jgi:hypothetical protein